MANEPVRLALVEDDQDVQELICAFFRPKGYQVTVYDDAVQLVREFQRSGVCPFEVIITDLMLPALSGIEFTRKAIELGVTAPIILFTSQRSAETAVKAIEAGAYDFVVKPIHFPQLQVSVERAVHLSRIRSENQTLKIAVAAKEGTSLEGIIGRSPSFLKAIDLAKRVAASSANIFVSGETGTGKEVIARAIHNMSGRRKGPFVAINCSAIPENLLESELFGHAKGAFTGAGDRKLGLFEEAEGGTLFLDEIGDLSLPLQAKLLRVIQERKIRRIGENQFRDINVRIISATHKELRREVSDGKFREDLFFRLNVIPVTLPPLRDRKEDILPLAEFFLKKFSVLNGKTLGGFSKGAMEALLKNSWRGNVRELENTVERAVVLAQGAFIEESDVLLEDRLAPIGEKGEVPSILREDGPIETLETLTNKYITLALKRNNGAKDKTARDLGIDRKTLYRRIQDLERTGLWTGAENGFTQ